MMLIDLQVSYILRSNKILSDLQAGFNPNEYCTIRQDIFHKFFIRTCIWET